MPFGSPFTAKADALTSRAGSPSACRKIAELFAFAGPDRDLARQTLREGVRQARFAGNWYIREALRRVGQSEVAVPLLAEALTAEDVVVAITSSHVIATLGQAAGDAVPALVDVLRDWRADHLGEPMCLPELRRLRDRGLVRLRTDIDNALMRIDR